MGENTKIEWADHTFNGWIGCSKVSAGCANCYAETKMDTRLHVAKWGKGNPRHRTSQANWNLPAKWNREAERAFQAYEHFLACGQGVGTFDGPVPRRPRVFCSSLSDWLDDEVPIEWLADLLCLVFANDNLDWLLLTKRPENFSKRLHEAMRIINDDTDSSISTWLDGDEPPPNVWIGVSVENQDAADIRIPKLLEIPAVVRFLSVEPMLGPVDLTNIQVPESHDQLKRPWETKGYTFNCLTDHDDNRFHQRPGGSSIDWVICGGESGPSARPMHPDWARSLRDQCQSHGVAYLFKQWGEYLPLWEKGGTNPVMVKVGKHKAGRTLDGRTWDEYPKGEML